MSLYITIYVFVYHLRSVGFMVLIGELHIKDQGSTLGLGHGVFWINIAKSEVYLHYRNCSNLFGILRREIEFQYYHCQIGRAHV